MSRNRTSIKLDKDVRDRLREQKSGGETYSQIIDKMIDKYEPEVMPNDPSGDEVLYQTNRSDCVAFQYAWLYDFARAVDEEKWVEISRTLLFNHLLEYQRFLDGGPKPSEPMVVWTPLQRTIRFASTYAKSYLGSTDPESAIEAIRRDMREEGRYLPHGIAEWIIQNTADGAIEQQNRVDEIKIGFTDFAGQVPEKRIELNSEFLEPSE